MWQEGKSGTGWARSANADDMVICGIGGDGVHVIVGGANGGDGLVGGDIMHPAATGSPGSASSTLSPSPFEESVEVEDLGEGVPKFFAHGAVEDKVDGGVEQRDEVHKVGERDVAALEEVVAQHAREEAK